MNIYQERTQYIKNKLSDKACLVTNDKNIFYFTGLWDSNGYLLITPDKATLFVDFRYEEIAEKTVNSADVMVYSSLTDDINNIISASNISELIVEADYMTINTYNKFKKNLACKLSDSDELDNIITEMRIIKSGEEVSFLQKAQDITEQALHNVLPLITEGMTERMIATELEHQMKILGAECASFDLITITGKKTSLPHGVPSDDIIKNGDFVTFDIGSTYKGYHSDMTRTFCVGEPTDEMKKVYDIVLTAHKMALSEVKPGVSTKYIDSIARDYIYKNGYEGCFGHSTGHGVGLDIHEQPTVGPKSDTILKEGMVITIEPGIYLKDKFGVRIEDTVLVTNNGYKSFAKTSKELTLL